MENHTFAIRTKESLEPAKTFSFRYIIILSETYKHVVHISSGANAQMVIISGVLTQNCITVTI